MLYVEFNYGMRDLSSPRKTPLFGRLPRLVELALNNLDPRIFVAPVIAETAESGRVNETLAFNDSIVS